MPGNVERHEGKNEVPIDAKIPLEESRGDILRDYHVSKVCPFNPPPYPQKR